MTPSHLFNRGDETSQQTQEVRCERNNQTPHEAQGAAILVNREIALPGEVIRKVRVLSPLPAEAARSPGQLSS